MYVASLGKTITSDNVTILVLVVVFFSAPRNQQIWLESDFPPSAFRAVVDEGKFAFHVVWMNENGGARELDGVRERSDAGETRRREVVECWGSEDSRWKGKGGGGRGRWERKKGEREEGREKERGRREVVKGGRVKMIGGKVREEREEERERERG